MPDLLLELFSEEIPARMQACGGGFAPLVTEKLVDDGLVYEGATAFVTPRRLALTIQGIPARQPDLKEESKGPRVGAPDAASRASSRPPASPRSTRRRSRRTRRRATSMSR